MTGTPAEWLILVLICVVVALIALAMHCEYKADESARIADDLANELEGLLFALSRAEIKTGVCCCGDSMENHDSGYNCGHSALDEWDYHGEPILRSAQQKPDNYKVNMLP